MPTPDKRRPTISLNQKAEFICPFSNGKMGSEVLNQTIYARRGSINTTITWERLWLEGNFGSFRSASMMLKQEILAISTNILPISVNILKVNRSAFDGLQNVTGTEKINSI